MAGKDKKGERKKSVGKEQPVTIREMKNLSKDLKIEIISENYDNLN